MSAAPRTIRFTLNGSAVEASFPPHLSLIELLREQFDLFGARESCGQGLCGCCTVLVDGNAVSSCLYLAAFADGQCWGRHLSRASEVSWRRLTDYVRSCAKFGRN